MPSNPLIIVVQFDLLIFDQVPKTSSLIVAHMRSLLICNYLKGKCKCLIFSMLSRAIPSTGQGTVQVRGCRAPLVNSDFLSEGFLHSAALVYTIWYNIETVQHSEFKLC